MTRILICANINNVIEICGCGGTGRRAGLRNQCQRRGGSSPFNRTTVRFSSFTRNRIVRKFYFFLTDFIKFSNTFRNRLLLNLSGCNNFFHILELIRIINIIYSSIVIKPIIIIIIFIIIYILVVLDRGCSIFWIRIIIIVAYMSSRF